MSKQFAVNLSERDVFDLWQFVSKSVQPKDKPAARTLEGVWDAFGLAKMQERVEALAEGESIKVTEFSAEAKPVEVTAVDLKAMVAYLEKLEGFGAAFVLRLMRLNDEMQRALDGKPKLQSIPEPEEVPRV